jgi:REP element-mobilizing transposase RayT
MSEKPIRKKIRLTDYNYSQNGFYFITICSHEHKPILGHIEEDEMILNDYAEKLDSLLINMSDKQQNIILDKYVFMPNHIHMVLVVRNDDLSDIHETGIIEFVQEFKSKAVMIYIKGVKEGLYEPFSKKIWQRSYYDSIIRNKDTYDLIWNYIDNNPLKWSLDKYYYDNSGS